MILLVRDTTILANVLNVYMNKEYKLIHSTKSVLFNNELGIAQANGWTAMPETLKSAPDFFSVLMEKEVSVPAITPEQSEINARVEWHGRPKAFVAAANSSEHSHDCNCSNCR